MPSEVFKFGTNDLTQTALGICQQEKCGRSGWLSPLRCGCRDDMGDFLLPYTENEIFKKNPFATLDQTGTGQLMKIAVEKGRSSRPNIKLGI